MKMYQKVKELYLHHEEECGGEERRCEWGKG